MTKEGRELIAELCLFPALKAFSFIQGMAEETIIMFLKMGKCWKESFGCLLGEIEYIAQYAFINIHLGAFRLGAKIQRSGPKLIRTFSSSCSHLLTTH